MKEKNVQQAGHAGRVARRAFMKKAAIGAALAVPAIESLTKSDILVKSALAATVPINVTGTWNGEMYISGNPWSTLPGVQLTQTGSAISGLASTFPITGTINGANIVFSWNVGVVLYTLTGIVTGNTMSGTWTGIVPGGTWTLTKV